MGILVVTGVVMTLVDPQHAGSYGPGNTWGLFLMLKHIFVVILIVLAVCILQVLLPGIEKAGAKGPSPELAKLQKRQMIISILSFVAALLVLLFTAVTSVV
jgi:putative copper export protein